MCTKLLKANMKQWRILLINDEEDKNAIERKVWKYYNVKKVVILVRSGYAETLIRRVIENSDANNWDAAVEEWDVVDCEEDEELAESCVCGKERLRYLFTIKNQFNGNLLFPIGSSCIRKFGRADLQEAVSIQEGMYKLLHAVEDDDYIELTSEFFLGSYYGLYMIKGLSYLHNTMAVTDG